MRTPAMATRLSDRAYRQKDVDLWYFIGNLPFKALETDPRYKAFLQKMNFSQLPETPVSR